MKKILPFISIQLILIASLVAPVFASDPVESPPVILAESHVMESFVQEGDLIVMIRYELPLENWQFDQATTTADQVVTTPYMQRATCEDDNPELISGLCYTSIFSGIAMQNVYNGKSSTDPIVGSRTLPRIGHGISALYFPPGHDLETDNLLTCLSTSSTLFTNPANECQPPEQHPLPENADRFEREKINGDVMANIANALDNEWPLRGLGVLANGNLTPFVAILFYEATPFAPRAAPSVFAMAVDLARDVETLSTTNTPLQDEIDRNATSTQASGGGVIAYSWFSDWVTNHYDDKISVQMFGSLVFLFIGLIFLIVSWAYLKNGLISSIFFSVPLIVGMMQGLVDSNLILVVLLVLAIPAIFTWFRRMA